MDLVKLVLLSIMERVVPAILKLPVCNNSWQTD